MFDRWEPIREYFRQRHGEFVSFAYVNAKGQEVRGFGVVDQVLDAHIVLKTKTARRYASFDLYRMPTLMRQFGIEVNHPLQAGFNPSCGGEREEV